MFHLPQLIWWCQLVKVVLYWYQLLHLIGHCFRHFIGYLVRHYFIIWLPGGAPLLLFLYPVGGGEGADISVLLDGCCEVIVGVVGERADEVIIIVVVGPRGGLQLDDVGVDCGDSFEVEGGRGAGGGLGISRGHVLYCGMIIIIEILLNERETIFRPLFIFLYFYHFPYIRRSFRSHLKCCLLFLNLFLIIILHPSIIHLPL